MFSALRRAWLVPPPLCLSTALITGSAQCSALPPISTTPPTPFPLQLCSTQSIWTIDLAHLLAACGARVQMLTVTIGANQVGGIRGLLSGCQAAEQPRSAPAGQRRRLPLAATSHYPPGMLSATQPSNRHAQPRAMLAHPPAGLQRGALLCGAHAQRQQPRGVAVPGALLPLYLRCAWID